MSTTESKPRRRNYKAMSDEKLSRVIDELRYEGDAFFRALDKGFAPSEDLDIAMAIWTDRANAALLAS